MNIPTDRDTKRKKTFCFIQFQHEESVPYAIKLFKDVRLFGRTLQMQNKSTGAGMPTPNQSSNQHQRTMSAPVMNVQQFRPGFVPPFQQNFQNPGFDNQQFIQQQQQMYQQQQFQQQQMNNHPGYNRQFSDRSHDRSFDRQNDHHRSHDRSQNRRGHHSHDRDDRRQHHHGHDYRDRSHDRRSGHYDNRNNQQRRRY